MQQEPPSALQVMYDMLGEAFNRQANGDDSALTQYLISAWDIATQPGR